MVEDTCIYCKQKIVMMLKHWNEYTLKGNVPYICGIHKDKTGYFKCDNCLSPNAKFDVIDYYKTQGTKTKKLCE